MGSESMNFDFLFGLRNFGGLGLKLPPAPKKRDLHFAATSYGEVLRAGSASQPP